MTRINLLPWREARRAQRQRHADPAGRDELRCHYVVDRPWPEPGTKKRQRQREQKNDGGDHEMVSCVHDFLLRSEG